MASIPIPAQFWRELTDDEFHEILTRDGINKKQWLRIQELLTQGRHSDARSDDGTNTNLS